MPRWRDRTALAAGALGGAEPILSEALLRTIRPQTAVGLALEQTLARAGRRLVAGVDEVGRGALAGPLVAVAVVLPAVVDERQVATLSGALDGVRDSKQLTAGRRRQLAERVRARAVALGQAVVPEAVIDAIGIGPANRLALRLALADLGLTPDYVLLDAVLLPELPHDQTALIGGDGRSLTIAAASIVAKVCRDDLLDRLATWYPVYGFDRHKGYGTAEHLAALTTHGPCALHRRSFAPVRSWAVGLLPAGVG